MRSSLTEYVAKGIYLGFLLFTAMQQPPSWLNLAWLALFTLGGLVGCLAFAAHRKIQEGYEVKGRLPAFILFLLLESPDLVYAGTLGGLALGTLFIRKPDENVLLWTCLGSGLLLGVLYWLVLRVKDRWTRFGLSLALASALVAAALYLIEVNPYFLSAPRVTGCQLLIGILPFYLLTFAGRAEESEVEIGAICAALGVALWLLDLAPNLRAIVLLVPLVLFYIYTTRIMPGLRVFKHAMRGLSYAKVGQHRQALRVFRRALELDPKNRLARDGLFAVHRDLDLTQLARDPETLSLVDVDLCLDRAGSLLLEGRPSGERLEEAHRLLDLVLNQRPATRPAVLYWRAVAHTHAGHLEQAAAELESVIDPADYQPNDPQRTSVLLRAWHLALLSHSELQRRVGVPQLGVPGRRMEAISGVERRLAVDAEDGIAWDLKRLLYTGLTEAEYDARPPASAADLDHGYVYQLGLAMLKEPDRWQRGAEFLRIAARGMPGQALSIYVHIAQACERVGDSEGKWKNYTLAQQAGKRAGIKNLSEEDRNLYFQTVKVLADHAIASNNLDAAIDQYHLYTEHERSGVETLRTLAGLYEKKGEPLNALRITEHGLLYSGSDKDLLERKDRYYFSVMPDQLKPKAESIRNLFDTAYCVKKARSILDSRTDDLEMIDWALHLADLAQVMEPKNVSAMVLRARAKLRKGEREPALIILEDLRERPPEKYATSDDEEAWYLANRLLADMYLNELSRPDLAIPCLIEYRKSHKSGADTMYKLGQAYEQTGDLKKARKHYEQVTMFEAHPLAPDAQDALRRLSGN